MEAWLKPKRKDWSQEEIEAADKAMQAMGQMGYDEFLAEVERQNKVAEEAKKNEASNGAV